MSDRASRMFALALGSALLLLGVVVSPPQLLGAFGAGATPPGEALHHGALLFKTALAVLGLCIMALTALPVSAASDRAPVQSAAARQRWARAALSLILLTAALLYLHRLDDGLWFDEIVTYAHYARLPFGQILLIYDDQNQHILYSLLAHAAFVAFGEGTWALRLPAVLFALGSIWALFMLGRLVSNDVEALLASALMAFSYQLVWFSQNARGYTGLLFLTLLSSWLFLRGLREARRRLWLLYAGSVALGMYIHMTMLFVVAGHFLMYVLACATQRPGAWRQRWDVLLCGFGLAGVLTFQLYALVVPQVLNAFAEAKILGHPWTQPTWAVLEFARGLKMSLSATGVVLAALVVFAAGLSSFVRTEPMVVQLLLLPVVICGMVKFGMGHHLWPRSFFFAFGFIVLVVIRGAMVLGRTVAARLGLRPGGGEALGTVMSLAVILASARSIPFAYGPKQDFAGALAFVQARKSPADALVTVGLATLPYRTMYPAAAQEVKSVAALDAVRAAAPRTWLVYTLAFELQDADPDLWASIERDFVVEKQFPGTLGGGAVFVCRSDHALPGS